MKYIFLFLLTVVLNRSIAQDCTQEVLLKKPGIWKEGKKGSQSGIQASDLTRAKKIVAALHEIIRTRYSPVAVELLYYGAYSSDFQDLPALQYRYSIIPLQMRCNEGRIETEHESSGFFSIEVNSFDAPIFESYTEENMPGYGFYFMTDMPVFQNGAYYFRDRPTTLGFGIPGKESGWLITKDDKLPYSYVTRKEFLERRKGILQRMEKQDINRFNETVVYKNKEKALKEVEYKNDAVKWQRYLKMDYQSVLDVNETNRIRSAKDYKKAYSKLEAQMNMSPDELQKEAVVKEDPHDYLSYLFTTDDDPFGKVLIKPNPSYFNSKLPRSIPQFFFVSQTGPFQSEIDLKIKNEMAAAIDVQALKNMLGKDPLPGSPAKKAVNK